jgi:hypothetical protein
MPFEVCGVQPPPPPPPAVIVEPFLDTDVSSDRHKSYRSHDNKLLYLLISRIRDYEHVRRLKCDVVHARRPTSVAAIIKEKKPFAASKVRHTQN